AAVVLVLGVAGCSAGERMSPGGVAKALDLSGLEEGSDAWFAAWLAAVTEAGAVTGGGWIPGTAGGGRANFGFVAHATGGGQIEVYDHSTGERFKGIVISSLAECLFGQGQF